LPVSENHFADSSSGSVWVWVKERAAHPLLL
jgi:hypothetical protein